MRKPSTKDTAELEEKQRTRELLLVFGSRPDMDVDRALRRASIQYEEFLESCLNAPETEGKKIQLHDLLLSDMRFFARMVHSYMFDGIYSNAGEFRDETDPLKGWVGFGGAGRTVYSPARFEGVAPNQIQRCLVEATQEYVRLTHTNDSTPPLYTALSLYQRIVRCHPFHDGNGRVARFIVTLILYREGMAIDWDGLLRTRKFLRKLNHVHSHREEARLFYMRWLVNYVDRFTYTVNMPRTDTEAN